MHYFEDFYSFKFTGLNNIVMMSWIPINMCQFFAMEFIAKKSSWIHFMDWVLDYFSNGSCVADF